MPSAVSIVDDAWLDENATDDGVVDSETPDGAMLDTVKASLDEAYVESEEKVGKVVA